jgi:ribonuclease BN (tRNA processing enzyme)
MKVTVLGSNAGAPSLANPASGYLVQALDTRVWMDAGPGTFMRLAGMMDPADLDAVAISHTHVDHCADLLGLFAYLAYGHRNSEPILVLAPTGTRDHLAAFARAGEGHVFHDVLDFHEVAPGDSVDVGPLSFAFGAAVHPVPALVTRISGGGSVLVYSGDTGPGGDLIELATGASTLLSEASLQGTRDADTYPYHLTAMEAGEIAAMAGAHRLVLTHLPFDLEPQLSIDQAASGFVGPIEYAHHGTTFDLPRTEQI